MVHSVAASLFRATFRSAVAALALTSLCGFCMADTALFDYIKEPDPAFRWKLISQSEAPSATVYNLELTSQNWQGITWKHRFHVIKPESITRPDWALLFITGGSNREEEFNSTPSDVGVVTRVAQAIGAVVAVVAQVPNQPLYDELVEDALIGYTFVNFMITGDTTWPLLLPMTKSAVRAMDATQAFAKENLGLTIDNFVVTGSSKRGWTTWLTGVVDPRVKAIAPMVIDVLNMGEQMPHQLAVWGAYSDELVDYTELNIQERMGTPLGTRLLNMVDPFAYRDRLTMPKLLLIGTNDTYWPVDAVNLYFDQLRGKNYILYVPNAGHGLGTGREASAGLAGFFMNVASGMPLPEFSWDVKRDGNSASLAVNARTKPVEVNLWSARSPVRDFRQATWDKVAIAPDSEGDYQKSVEIPETGYIAFYGELVHPSLSGQDYSLCTTVRIFSAQE